MVLQTCLPDYRLPLFEQLVSSRPEAHVLCGRDYFTLGLALCTGPAAWRTFATNRFLFGRALLWQLGVWKAATGADILIAEFNPRILSTWVILARRKLGGKRTLVWGHLWGQHGPQWLARRVRLFMLQLCDGAICYTVSQAEELQTILPGYPAWAAGNSCVTREQCGALNAPTRAGCITYVGRLIRSKKPLFLLEAFAHALSRLTPDTKLLLIGDGGEWKPLRTRIEELGLTGRVEMPGHVVEVAELKKIYSRSVVAVSPGYVGLSAIQSMSFGVPMLVSRDEPHSPEIEACVEGHTSAFFETNKTADLANKIVDFFRPDSPWREKREKISNFIADNYTFDGMVTIFVSAIETVDPERPGRKVEEAPRVAVVWAQFGPYHLARLRALRQRFGATNIVGVEIGSRTLTYRWERGAGQVTGVVTLMPGRAAEDVSVAGIYRAARRVFQEREIGVVFAPSYWPASSLAIIMAARNAGARVVMMNDSHAHTAKARGVWSQIKRWLVLQFDAALVAGAPQKDYFTGMGLDPKRIVTGYDAVDNGFFERRAANAKGQARQTRDKHGLPERYFLNVGRMVWKKNLETLIDAYKQVKDRLGAGCPRLVFVGSGNLEGALRDRCLSHGLSVWQRGASGADDVRTETDVLFYGFRQVDELPEFYALADCFILPSREEEWGLVVNEAMASGLPVIVSRVAGCARDLVRHGENGFVFDPFDFTALAGHLEAVARQPKLIGQMGIASQRIIAGWGCEAFAEAAHQATRMAQVNKIHKRRFPQAKHVAALVVLTALDLYQRLRRLLDGLHGGTG